MEMTTDLFNYIIDTAQDCIFWKDKERRFLGVNQAFLDFYGFPSADVLIGKTDEDMGWHSDPEPYMQDELRVLSGKSTYKVPGKCVIKGEERDIIASKRPVYEDGQIIGLVGSFSDVTDVVRRNNEKQSGQILYTAEQLRRIPYFDRLIDEISMDELLDSLTGVLSRAYILDFAKSLIAEKKPFTFMIVDLDNFKYINDTCGHHAGDLVLMDVTRGLVSITDGFGVVGRFGGDELLIIDLRDITYDDKKSFLSSLYGEQHVLRKELTVDDHTLFVTGTTGCASYPTDAADYNGLFSQMDKALYRGKRKGRNCYIIYVKEKHGAIEIKKLAGQGIYTNMRELNTLFSSGSGLRESLRAVTPLLHNELHLSGLFYVDCQGILRSATDECLRLAVGDLSPLMTDDLYQDHSLEQIRKHCPALYPFMKDRETGTVLILRIDTGSEADAYLVVAEPRVQRLWQETDLGLLYYLAGLLSVHPEELTE